MPADPIALRETARAAASERVWSQAVLLVRDGKVHPAGVRPGEAEFEIRVPARPSPFTVVISTNHGEWECDCPSREAICPHAAAAIMLMAADETSAPVPNTKPLAVVVYKLTPATGGFHLDRAVRQADGTSVALDISLRGFMKHTPVAANDADLLLDQLLLARKGAITGDRVDRILTALGECRHVEWQGQVVHASGDPITPRVRITDDGDGVMMTLERPPEVTAIVSMSVARCGDAIRPIGAVDIGGVRMERLPISSHYPREAWPQLIASVLPPLAKRLPVVVETDRLPALGGRELPRVEFDIGHEGDRLEVMALLVYGDPPRARVDAGRLVHLGGAVPQRDEDAERSLLFRLRDALNLVPGRRVAVTGKEMFALHEQLARWLRDESNGSGRAARTAIPLEATLKLEGRSLQLELSAGGKFANPELALRAWAAGAELVPLIGGGWGQLPRAWFEAHGHRVADLLSARGRDGQVPLSALPDLARLCGDLDTAPPPELERLRPMFESFDGIPAARLSASVAAWLRPYQRRGVDWLCFARDAGLGCILADDMGLGKTIQAIAAIERRALVVMPTSVLFNWEAELRRFRPELRVASYHGSRRKLDADADIVLTTYPILRNDAEILAETEWQAIVLDESQAIKNPDSQVARAAYSLRAAWRLTLSGTPVENRLDELWSQMHFANPGLLGGRADFRDRWAEPITDGDPDAAGRLRERIRPFVLRRLKREVAPELPPRTEAVLHVELEPHERTMYDTVRAATQREIVNLLAKGGGVMAALEALLRLRQAACHTALLPGQPRGDDVPPSSKVARLIEVLLDASAGGHKSLVFSQWTSLLDLIEPALRAADLGFVRLDGSTRDREGVVGQFQGEGGPPVMLLSLKAGGSGLNLTAADHVFLCDPWWNPAVEAQAADRAHRIGQDKPVMIYRLVARDTVEERILELQEKKRALAAAALDGGGAAGGLTRDDLLALLA